MNILDRRPSFGAEDGVSIAEVQAGMMLGCILVASAVLVPLAATGRGVAPIRVPQGTHELTTPGAGERAFVTPVGLEGSIQCGDTHSNLSTHSYPVREVTLSNKTVVICGSPKDKLPSGLPKVTVKIKR